MCLGMFLLGFVLYGTLRDSWTLFTIFFPLWGKFSSIISSNIFSVPFFFSSSSETPIIQMLVHLILSQKSMKLSSILFILFPLFYSQELFPLFYIPGHLSVLLPLILLLIPSIEFLISFIVFLIIVCLLFSSSRSLLNVSCISSILVQDFGSSLLSLLWILFRVDCLFPLHFFGLVCFYLAFSSALCFPVFSFDLTYCVWGLLFTGCTFIVPIGFCGCTQWVRLVQCVV